VHLGYRDAAVAIAIEGHNMLMQVGHSTGGLHVASVRRRATNLHDRDLEREHTNQRTSYL
jgi:hypothetical protein